MPRNSLLRIIIGVGFITILFGIYITIKHLNRLLPSQSPDDNISIATDFATIYVKGANDTSTDITTLVQISDDTIIFKENFFYSLKFKRKISSDFTLMTSKSSVIEVKCIPEIRALSVVVMDESTARLFCELDTLAINLMKEGALWLNGKFRYVTGSLYDNFVLFIEKGTHIDNIKVSTDRKARIIYEN